MHNISIIIISFTSDELCNECQQPTSTAARCRRVWNFTWGIFGYIYYIPFLFIYFLFLPCDTFFYFRSPFSTHFNLDIFFFCNKKIEIGKNENDVSRQRRRSYVWSDSRWSLIESALGTTSWLVGETGITQRLKWEEEDKKNRRGEKKLGIWWCPHSPNSYQTFKRKICTTTLPLLRLYNFFFVCFVWLFSAFISVLGFYFFIFF